MIETKTLLTVAVIAGAMLLVTGTSIEMAFAQANQVAPGQNFGGPHRNPSSGDFPPPGQTIGAPTAVGNSGQCQKLDTTTHAECFPKS